MGIQHKGAKAQRSEGKEMRDVLRKRMTNSLICFIQHLTPIIQHPAEGRFLLLWKRATPGPDLLQLSAHNFVQDTFPGNNIYLTSNIIFSAAINQKEVFIFSIS